jgi:hypothetical protein
MEIIQATLADLDNIKSLQEKYHVSNLTEAEKQQKGFVTMRVTDEQFTVLIERKGVFIAVENNELAAYALTSNWDFYRQWPIITVMEAVLPDFLPVNGVKLTVENSFQYGPVCIDEAFRGRDILTLLFDKISAFYKKDYAFATTFINKKNERSMRAHNKRTPLSIIGEFSFNDNEYYALACPTF